MLTEGKKHQLKIAGVISLFLGVAMFGVLWVMTKNIVSIGVVPVAVLIGMGQAYLSPNHNEDDD